MLLEASMSHASQKLDDAVGAVSRGRLWFLWVGLFAIVATFVLHTPSPSMLLTMREGMLGRMVSEQVAHPLTPLNLDALSGGADPEFDGVRSHFDKVAFRLTIPIVGHLLGTGNASFIILNYLAGFAFFPLLAQTANKITGDRVTATYLTLAFATCWAGSHFFDDHSLGDGVAWLLLLLAVSFRSAVLIFASVFLAGFTDERALIASSGVAVFWLVSETQSLGARREFAALVRAPLLAVFAAWLCYFAARTTLHLAFGLETGTSEFLSPPIFWHHMAYEIPFGIAPVFEGLWIWLALGAASLVVARRWLSAVGYFATLIVTASAAIAVWDIQRSLGFLFVLLPAAWLGSELTKDNERHIARACLLLGILLTVPFYTPLRIFYGGGGHPA